MNKKLIYGLVFTFLLFSYTCASAYDRDELNRRLISCTPTKDFNAGSALYQISGLTNSICIFKILNNGTNNEPNLICRVPSNRMREMTSLNPLTVQKLKNEYCKMAMKKNNKEENHKGIYIY